MMNKPFLQEDALAVTEMETKRRYLHPVESVEEKSSTTGILYKQ